MEIKFHLMIKKTEMVIFESKQKKFEGDLKVRVCGKIIHPTESIEYLVVKIDTNLHWQCQCQVNHLPVKLIESTISFLK